MDIIDGMGTAHDPVVQDQMQGRSRPEIVNHMRGEISLLLGTTAGDSVDWCFDGLVEFWDTHVVNIQMERIRGLQPVDARAGDTQRVAAFVLADPRCILRNGIRIPSDKSMFTFFFDEMVSPKTEGSTVQAAYKYHCRLARLVFVDIKFVLEQTSHSLRTQHARALPNEQGGLEYKDLAEMQQEQIRALVEKSLEKKSLVQIYGEMAAHPSILFIYGWLCYKSGTARHLLRAISMLTDAGKRGLLRATCGILRALCRFYIILESLQTLTREYVTADLLEALSVAARSQEHDVVETPLLIEAHSALAVLFMSSWANEGIGGIVREIQPLRARRHCMDAHRLYYMWRGMKMPSRLLLRASRLCEMDPPGSMPWLQTEHVLSHITLKWRKKQGDMPERVGRNMQRIRTGKGTSRSQTAGYESFASLVLPTDPEAAAKIAVEATKWKKTGHSLELRKQPPKRLCQLCGAVPAAMPCNRCKLVIYCSNNCAHFDRVAGVHNTICIGHE